jgi:periplasmic copper chaperone A
MRQLQPGLEIKPGETVALEPGSYHLMFLDLQKSPVAGTNLKGTLVFEKAGAVDIEYKVEPAGARSSAKAGKGSGSGSGAGRNASQ